MTQFRPAEWGAKHGGLWYVASGPMGLPEAKRTAKTADAAPQLLGALERLLADAEAQHADPLAHGMPIEDPEHPWHATIMAAREAIAAATGENAWARR